MIFKMIKVQKMLKISQLHMISRHDDMSFFFSDTDMIIGHTQAAKNMCSKIINKMHSFALTQNKTSKFRFCFLVDCY